MEARSYSPDQARQLLQKAKEYKADLAKLKEDARRAGAGAGVAADTRAELGLAGDYYQVGGCRCKVCFGCICIAAVACLVRVPAGGWLPSPCCRCFGPSCPGCADVSGAA